MTAAPLSTVPTSSQLPVAARYVLAATLFVTYMLFALGWRAGDHLVASFGFNASRTALLTNAITLAQMTGSLIAANVLLRLGARNAFTFGSVLVVFGGLVALTEAYPLVFLIRFVLGIGGALVVVFMSAIVAKVFTGKELQVVNGINSVAFNTGLAVALTFAVRMDANPVGAVLTVAACSAAVLVLWLVISRGSVAQEQPSEQATDASYTMADGFREGFNWVFALAYTGLLSYYIVAFTFMDAQTVRWVVYAGVIGALAGTAVATRVPNALKPRVVVISAVLQLISAAAVLALSEHRFATLVGVILGLAIFFPMPFFVQLAFIRPGVTPRKISVTFSIFWAVSYGGSVLFIQLFAWIADRTGGLGPGNVPVSTTPMIFIVLVEGTFLIGAVILARMLSRTHVDELESETVA